jgi:Rrf2 family protein
MAHRTHESLTMPSVISQTAEYALRAVACLAAQPQAPMTAQQIADATHVPAGYLVKVLQPLVRGGLVHSQRGLHGGFALTKPPDEIAVLEVISAVDPLEHIHTCPLGLKAHGKNLCPLHRRLDDAVTMIEQAFGDTTFADLLAEPTKSRPLGGATCRGPVAAAR